SLCPGYDHAPALVIGATSLPFPDLFQHVAEAVISLARRGRNGVAVGGCEDFPLGGVPASPAHNLKSVATVAVGILDPLPDITREIVETGGRWGETANQSGCVKPVSVAFNDIGAEKSGGGKVGEVPRPGRRGPLFAPGENSAGCRVALL